MNQKRKMMITHLFTYALVICAYFVCQMMIKGEKMSLSLEGQLVPICAYIVLAVSLNLTVGISGELSLGHAGFMYVGAITGVIASMWMRYTFTEETAFFMMFANLGIDFALVRMLFSLIIGGIFAGIVVELNAAVLPHSGSAELIEVDSTAGPGVVDRISAPSSSAAL